MNEIAVEPGVVLYSPVNPTNEVYRIKDGLAAVIQDLEGHKMAIDLVGHGEFLLPSEYYSEEVTTAKAISDIEYLPLGPMPTVLESYPADKVFGNRIKSMSEIALNSRFMKLEERILWFFEEIYDSLKLTKSEEYEVPLTQKFIAELVGGTRENINSILNIWKKEGLFIQAKRGKLTMKEIKYLLVKKT